MPPTTEAELPWGRGDGIRRAAAPAAGPARTVYDPPVLVTVRSDPFDEATVAFAPPVR